MARLAFRALVGVLWAVLAGACLGGQTGQPTSLDCGASGLSPTATWSGTTVATAARAFEGTYRAGLLWQVEPRAATSHTPVELSDSAELVIAYGGGKATRNCDDQLLVPVSVTLTTSASGVSDSGPATLTITRLASGVAGALVVRGKQVALGAGLPEVATGAPPSGGFDALFTDLPGASASFTEEQQ